jgi:hypothetical protein
MPFSIYVDESTNWLVVDFARVVNGKDLVASREQAAALNEDGHIRDFILDFAAVSEFVLAADAVEHIMRVDKARAAKLPAGRCAIVAPRDLVEIGTTYLAAISALPLDFRTFDNRQRAEAWLRGDLPGVPPTLPRRR